eukprot:5214668-Pleurochrysis_carterae.AAC.1
MNAYFCDEAWTICSKRVNSSRTLHVCKERRAPAKMMPLRTCTSADVRHGATTARWIWGRVEKSGVMCGMSSSWAVAMPMPMVAPQAKS